MVWDCYLEIDCYWLLPRDCSLRKQPFLFAPRRLGRFARRDVGASAKEIYRDYSNSLTLSNASEILWSWILEIKSKFRLVVVLLIQPIAIFMFSLLSHRGIVRELKQQRPWRLRKRHLKSEFALPQTLSRLFHLVQFIKCWQFSLELNSKRLHWSSGKEKESRCLVISSSIKREMRHFHVVVVHVQSCSFVNINLLLFCRSRCRRRRRCLSSL